MSKLLRRGAEAGALRDRGLSSFASPSSPCSRPQMTPAGRPLRCELIPSLVGEHGKPSQAAALLTAGAASPRSLRPQEGTTLLSAAIHRSVGAGRYAQAIRSTKELIRQLSEKGRGDPGRGAYDALRRFQRRRSEVGGAAEAAEAAGAFDVLIVALSAGGLLDEALWVFRQLDAAPSVNACNALLSGLLRAGRIRCLWGLYADMVGRRREPSGVTHNILLNACRWEGDLCRALRLLDEMLSPSVVSYTTVICGLCEDGRLPDALALFRRMRVPPNLYTFHALMAGHCRLADLRGALALYGAALRRGLQPNAVTFGILADALSKDGEGAAAADEARTRRLFRGMTRLHGVAPNAYAYNSLIHGLCKAGQLAEALELPKEMERAGVQPDAVTCGALMKGLCDAGRPREAAELLRQKRDERGRGNLVVLYNTLIHGHCRQGNTEEAARVWSQMIEEGVEPDAITFSVLVDAHCKTGDSDAAAAVFSEMRVRGRAADVVAYTSLIDGHMKKGNLAEARRLSREMAAAGVPANAFTLCALVDGLCRQGRSREAMHLLLESAGVVDRGPTSIGACPPNGVAYMALIRGLHADAQDFKAGRIFMLMREAGFVPDAPTYALLLEGQRRAGRPRNAMALLADGLKAGVTPEEKTTPFLWGRTVIHSGGQR